jgi:NADPH-dependent ferric siderophore reductase
MAQTSPPMPRYIYVHSSEQISPHLQRIYFSSDDFSDFPLNQNGAHIKLFFPEQPELKPQLPTRNTQGKVVWPEGKKPVTRTYTIRQFLEPQQLLIVDFVRHEEFGIAANWAIQAQPGHVLGLAGPGGPKRFNPHANYWIFIGDLSALPMISASLEQLPEHAHGQIWIEIENKTEQIEFIYPPSMQLHWIIQEQEIETQIINSLKHLDWDSKQISVSLAGENARVVSLRHIFRNQFKLEKSHLYAVPYWKQGENEEGYHQERHRVMDE